MRRTLRISSQTADNLTLGEVVLYIDTLIAGWSPVLETGRDFGPDGTGPEQLE